MKKIDDKVIILQSDGSISKIEPSEVDSYKTALGEYILIPDTDSDSYLIVCPSKYLDIKYAKIVYILHGELKEMAEDADDIDIYNLGTEVSPDQMKREIEVHNAVELYQSLWSILKIRMVGELLADNYDYPDLMFGLLIQYISIHVVFKNDKEMEYEDYMYDAELSYATQMIKMASKISNKFAIPSKEFRYTDSFFQIKRNKWNIVNINELKPSDFVGFISDITMQVYFDTYGVLYKYLTHPFGIHIWVTTMRNLYIEYGCAFDQLFSVEPLTADDIEEIDLYDTFIIFDIERHIPLHNDRITFLMNINYFFRYLEGMMISIDKDYEDEVVVIVDIVTDGNKTVRFTRCTDTKGVLS